MAHQVVGRPKGLGEGSTHERDSLRFVLLFCFRMGGEVIPLVVCHKICPRCISRMWAGTIVKTGVPQKAAISMVSQHGRNL